MSRALTLMTRPPPSHQPETTAHESLDNFHCFRHAASGQLLGHSFEMTEWAGDSNVSRPMLAALGLLCLGWVMVIATWNGVGFDSYPLWAGQLVVSVVLASGLPSLVCVVIASGRSS